ncbi:hypothetical protein [Kitasatospora cineracea]|uniref:Phage terminase large subunit-like protein n=1 Tax=Kitasatospora cineracea TaxID=88074 RepID=A0A3N4R265_9ACTN|nr:hypothetical protein [Kitasatospora cineracea]RPE27292.1 hypothetical protein EDD38_7437 [Kitasatospora cineracea]
MTGNDRVVRWPTLGFLVGDWIEQHCVIPDGFSAGEPYELTDEMLWFYLSHYRVKPEATRERSMLSPASAFYYRRSQLVRPQKWGKGPLTASQVCVEAVGPAVFAGWAEGGERYDCRLHGCDCGWQWEYEPGDPMGMPWPTPLIQITAFSEEQTDNIYGALKPMIDKGPLSDLIPKTGEEFIRLPGGGRIDTVTSSAQSRLGQRVTFVPQDETGIWTTENKMQKVADTQRRGLAGMGGRSTETTNGWDPSENSVAQRTYEAKVKDIYRDFAKAPGELDYKKKADRRKIHQAVYGDSWWVDLDVIEGEALELLERDPAQAERFFGNRIVAGVGAWLGRHRWDALAAPREVPDGTTIVIGFDGSDIDDWTGLRAETLDGYQFTPTYSSLELPTVWNPADWGGQVPRLEVDAALDEVMTRYKVVRGYFDPPYWESEIDAWAAKYGDKRIARWATYRTVQMHAAAERLLTDVTKASATFRHDGCEDASTHVGNARRSARTGGRYVLSKPAPHQKIDMAVVSILTHEAAFDAIADGLAKPPPRRRTTVLR